MNNSLIEFKDFLGIIKSQANRDPRSFQTLVNLWSGNRPGDLIPRIGYQMASDSDGAPSAGFKPDGIFFNDFGDIQSRISIESSNVMADPSFGDSGLAPFVPRYVLTETFKSAVLATVVTSTTITIGRDLTNGISNNALYTILRNVSKVPHEFVVVVGVVYTSPTVLTLTLNRAISWTIGDVVVFYRNDFQANFPDLTYGDGASVPYTIFTYPQFLNLGGKNQVGIFGLGDNTYHHPLWIGRIINNFYFNNAFKFNGLYFTTLMDDFSYGAFSPNTHHIQISSTDVSQTTDNTRMYHNAFQFSFALKLDGFSETKLIYNVDPYGNVPSVASVMTDTNVVDFPEVSNTPPPTEVSTQGARDFGSTRTPIRNSTTTATVVQLKISTNRAELINRRVSHIVLYSRQLSIQGVRGGSNQVFFRAAWRKVMDISINDSGWSYSSGTYSITKTITADMVSGQLYVSRNSYYNDEDLTKKVYYAASLSSRIFVRNDVDNQVVYFSPINTNGFCESVLPDSNYFLITKKAGPIVGMSSINDKLIVWKKFSTWTISTNGLPELAKDDYVNNEIGLASIASVAKGTRLIFFASYSGIFATDGFKLTPLNRDWIEEYLSYPTSSIESSVGFYEATTNSYYLYVNNILWRLSLDLGHWSQIDFSHVADGNVIYGLPKFATTDLSGKIIYTGLNSGDSNIYQYPRTDGAFKDTVYTLSFGLKDFSILASLKTNDAEIPLEEFVYLNNAYFRGESVPSTTLQFTAGSTVIGSTSITSDRQVFPIRSMFAVSRFAIVGSLTYSAYFVLRQIGVLTKSMRRAGSIKVGA